MVDENCVEVVLGVFGTPNRHGDIYHMPKSELKKAMDRMVGKVIGEVGQSQLMRDDFTATLRRVARVDDTNAAGKLLSYDIVDTPEGHTVTGRVALNSKFLDTVVLAPERGSFGIRALSHPRKVGEEHINNVMNLICFDYLPPKDV